ARLLHRQRGDDRAGRGRAAGGRARVGARRGGAAALAAGRGVGDERSHPQAGTQGGESLSDYRSAGVIGGRAAGTGPAPGRGGAWGTALAQVCARAGLQTTLWAREPEVVESVRGKRENTLFLPGVTLDERMAATGELADLAGCDLILAVPPAQHMRATLTAFA